MLWRTFDRQTSYGEQYKPGSPNNHLALDLDARDIRAVLQDDKYATDELKSDVELLDEVHLHHKNPNTDHNPNAKPNLKQNLERNRNPLTLTLTLP